MATDETFCRLAQVQPLQMNQPDAVQAGTVDDQLSISMSDEGGVDNSLKYKATKGKSPASVPTFFFTVVSEKKLSLGVTMAPRACTNLLTS